VWEDRVVMVAVSEKVKVIVVGHSCQVELMGLTVN
jgi:hypothetical protein